VQLCIVHLVRAALKYVVDKDSDQVIADLKKIYQAQTVLEAEAALESFAQAWGDKYGSSGLRARRAHSDVTRCMIMS
jgi:putative transposase